MRRQFGLETSMTSVSPAESALRVQEATRSMHLPPEMASLLMITFNLVWREALVEAGLVA